MARPGRESHLDADSVEEGFARWLRVCGNSGLPNVRRLAQNAARMRGDMVDLPEAVEVKFQRAPVRKISQKALDAYIEEFENEAAWGDEPAEELPTEEDLEGTGVASTEELEEQIARLQARMEELHGRGGDTEMPRKTRARNRSRSTAAAAPARQSRSRRRQAQNELGVGTVFAYTNTKGETSEHEIVSVDGNYAFTDDDKRFKLTTLETLMQREGLVEIVA